MAATPKRKNKKSKVVLKKRWISKKAVSHWKKLSKEQASHVMSTFESSLCLFADTGDEQIETLLRSLKKRFKRYLEKESIFPDDELLYNEALSTTEDKLKQELQEEQRKLSNLQLLLRNQQRKGIEDS